MSMKGGSEIWNKYFHWTLLQSCGYYMATISEPFVGHIKNEFANSSLLFQYLGTCG